MPKNLVVVESPAKAKTIAKYLGKDFRVESSNGHIRDLPKKKIGVNPKDNFEPIYEITPEKQQIVNNLKKAAKGSQVWLASDGDREGEAIAWHVAIAIGEKPDNVKRIVFHEITKPAIEEAVAKPRSIDMKLVEAQQARRLLDRLVGYELSPVLWRKVRAGLSAGRVQSVAVRLIVERERQIKDFDYKSDFKLTAEFDTKPILQAELDKHLATKQASKKWLESVKKSTFTVSDIRQRPATRSPGAPFTTSTLQQEAGRRLGYSVRQTMTLAQKLYEAGHITYMRTDSTTISGIAIDAAKRYITREYGEKYSQVRQYKTKSKAAQEAHEAIRPTRFEKLEAGHDSQQQKIYQLIWKRALASQMTASQVEVTETHIDISGHSEKFIATGEVLVFDGYQKIYGGGKDDRHLPKLKVGQKLDLRQILASEAYGRPPARYSEPSLVRKLEELGIGRPSTYAPTISTIQDRGYIEKSDVEGESRQAVELLLKDGRVAEQGKPMLLGADKNKLLPTTLADIVTDFLIKYFGSIVDYDFTAKAENELDDVADGKLQWQEMLKDFYKRFHPLIEKSDEATRAEVSQARTLGKDPTTKLPVIVRFGRYGPVLQLGETPKDKEDKENAPRFAPMPEGATLERITLKEALPMFKLPRTVGKTKEGQEITADIGRFGPYVKANGMFVSIKDYDPLTITLEAAQKLISEKQKAIAERNVADFGEIKILRGPYGPYVTDGKLNAKVPKAQDPAKLTEADAKKLLSASGKAKRTGRRARAS